MSYELIFLVNTFASFFMTGLIWIVQLVHYPSFHYVGSRQFEAFQKHHMRSIGLIVVPVMLVELVSSFGLAWISGFLSADALGFYTVVAIWAATGLFSVPMHSILERGKDENAIRKLVATNWIRTMLWSFKSALSLYLLWQLT